VAAGTPEEIVQVARSYTGRFLAPVLGRPENKRKVQAAE
jgi:excinuclease UvrABC ATPase subunit